MAKQNRTTLKGYFETGDIPSQAQYADLIDSKLNLAETGVQVIDGTISSSFLEVKNDITADGNLTITGSAIFGTNTVTINGTAGHITASGNVSASGNVIANTVNTGQGNNELYAMNQDVQTTDSVTFANITASGDISASGTIFADNFQSTGGDVNGISFVDDLNVTGDITASNINTTGIITASGITTTALTIAGAIFGQSTDTFWASGSSGKIYYNGGNVGIGTTTPDSKLTVVGDISASGNIKVDGDVFISRYIRHTGDNDTHIEFLDNKIQLHAGNIPFITIDKDASTPFPLTINNGGNRINFRVQDKDSNLLLKTDSEAFKVNLYHAGNQKLETAAGGINVTGEITASGNISSSGNIIATEITASGNISASGNIMTEDLQVDTITNLTAGAGIVLDAAGFIGLDSAGGDIRFRVGGVNQLHLDMDGTAGAQVISPNVAGDDIIFKNQGGSSVLTLKSEGQTEIHGNITASGNISASGNIILEGHITASGNISSSGNIIADKFFGDTSGRHIAIDSTGTNLGTNQGWTVGTHITASGNISASGNITATGTGSFAFVTGKSFVSSSVNSSAVTIIMTEANYPGGSIIGLDMDNSDSDIIYTLPALTAGLRYTFLVNESAAGGAFLRIISPSASTLVGVAVCDDGNEDISGNQFTIAAGKAFRGTRLEVVSDGAIYHLTAFCLCNVDDVSTS